MRNRGLTAFYCATVYTFVICHEVWNERHEHAALRHQQVKLKTNL